MCIRDRVRKGTGVSSAFSAPTASAIVDQYTVLKLSFDGSNASQIVTDDDTFIQDIRFTGGSTATALTLIDHTDFGGEIRSIASACVYGNKGLDADGANNLAYLVNQNFAYIGAGKNVTNDSTLTVRANEVIKTNNAKVYYTTQDQRGNFRVGDNFLVDLENERTSFDVESIFATNSTAQIREGNNTITLQPGLITQNEIAIQGNSIEAFRGNLNFNSTGIINFQGNVVAPQITTTGNFTINGSLQNLGDSPTDTVYFNTPISQNFEPGSSEAKKLGTVSKRWQEVNSQIVNVNTFRSVSYTHLTLPTICSV